MSDTAPVTETPKPKHLILKLAEIVKKIDHVEKAGENKFQNYKYVRATDVAWAVRKALSEYNIFLVADCITIRNYEIPAKEGHMQAVDVTMQFSFFDGDSPETPPIVLHSFGTGTDKGDKAVYKAQTGALKYGLRHAFLVPDDSDPEGDASVDVATGKAAADALGKGKVEKLKKGDKSVLAGPESPETASLFYAWHDESQTATIFGDEGYKSANRDLLKPLWSGAAQAIVATADQLETLKYQLEQRKVPFRPLKAAK
jgi:hypothetical protein